MLNDVIGAVWSLLTLPYRAAAAGDSAPTAGMPTWIYVLVVGSLIAMLLCLALFTIGQAAWFAGAFALRRGYARLDRGGPLASRRINAVIFVRTQSTMELICASLSRPGFWLVRETFWPAAEVAALVRESDAGRFGWSRPRLLAGALRYFVVGSFGMAATCLFCLRALATGPGIFAMAATTWVTYRGDFATWTSRADGWGAALGSIPIGVYAFGFTLAIFMVRSTTGWTRRGLVQWRIENAKEATNALNRARAALTIIEVELQGAITDWYIVAGIRRADIRDKLDDWVEAISEEKAREVGFADGHTTARSRQSTQLSIEPFDLREEAEPWTDSPLAINLRESQAKMLKSVETLADLAGDDHVAGAVARLAPRSAAPFVSRTSSLRSALEDLGLQWLDTRSEAIARGMRTRLAFEELRLHETLADPARSGSSSTDDHEQSAAAHTNTDACDKAEELAAVALFRTKLANCVAEESTRLEHTVERQARELCETEVRVRRARAALEALLYPRRPLAGMRDNVRSGS
ncbi:hypothetical protein ABT304_08850 [Nocardioides sp. NPDC000445]|uniref:hypothetical protein n=1 Tax=Nocardioides sp. NPDC000445 TaxID=3154257 RepID=UPI00332A061B